jgi:hypothetical protein
MAEAELVSALRSQYLATFWIGSTADGFLNGFGIGAVGGWFVKDTDANGIGDLYNDNEDTDGDEWADVLDNCPAAANGDQTNRDSDGVGDTCDLCPDYAASNADLDGNGIGDPCECGDQNGDGTVNVGDLVAINAAIFDPAKATSLCDTNNDQQCNVSDIVGANRKIFGRPAYCSRYPPPGL